MDWIPASIEKATEAIVKTLPLLDKHSVGFWRLLTLIIVLGALLSGGSILFKAKPIEFKGKDWTNDDPCRFVHGGLVCEH
ncbi:MAG TPA: hypothetical protein V6D19_05730 [Stenomitos sp.]